MFAISLCAEGIDLGGGARRCFPLAVRNVRPIDGASLRYRVEAPVPAWVAPWLYDLDVRFPGGRVEVPRAVRVGVALRGSTRAHDSAAERLDLAPRVRADERGVRIEASDAGLVRVHVGAAGFSLSGARFEGFPLPDGARGFAPGFVALIRRAENAPALMTKRQAARPLPFAMEPVQAFAGQPVRLRVRALPTGARVFWWLDPARGARGSEVTTVFLQRGRVPLELLMVTPDGRAARTEEVLPIWQRRAFGCSLGARERAAPFANSLVLSLALLIGAGCCRRGARFAIAARDNARAPRRRVDS